MVEITLEGSILSPNYAGAGSFAFSFMKMPDKNDLQSSYFFTAATGIRYLSYQLKYR